MPFFDFTIILEFNFLVATDPTTSISRVPEGIRIHFDHFPRRRAHKKIPTKTPWSEFSALIAHNLSRVTFGPVIPTALTPTRDPKSTTPTRLSDTKRCRHYFHLYFFSRRNNKKERSLRENPTHLNGPAQENKHLENSVASAALP
ncbi:hypothetical protein EVAR_14908_1 [Eumeta japonica]|uniref:Uncharacterized protein n=1 Tax=Eumeta variegata TaxID=151549 RepID=A0A4C1XMI9_EUMVA|nr:hypothetical protein EVAR_14908_1 [Eumeta japonica]